MFESVDGGKYGTTTIRKIITKSASYSLKDGTDIPYIQSLLGHSSTKTTEIYPHVASKSLNDIKTPLEILYLNKIVDICVTLAQIILLDSIKYYKP
ncbi:MAG: tyrosine-type recombinase/integrase [Bacteroidales bacterium]|nr:tyrosine-type recombinase/integrase [Bacteroidales bacterium]